MDRVAAAYGAVGGLAFAERLACPRVAIGHAALAGRAAAGFLAAMMRLGRDLTWSNG